MLFLDIAISGVIGQVVVLRDTAQIPSTQRALQHSAFAPAAVFVSTVYIPAVMLFLLEWPALSWLYILDPDAHLHTMALVALFLVFVLGFVTTHALVRSGRRKLAIGLTVALMGLIGSLPALFWNRASVVAPTCAAFDSGEGQGLVASGLLWTSMSLVGLIVAAFALLWWRFLPPVSARA